jgi:hypothetical protein
MLPFPLDIVHVTPDKSLVLALSAIDCPLPTKAVGELMLTDTSCVWEDDDEDPQP